MLSNMRPKCVLIGKNYYFKADSLKKYDPAYFIGTSRSVRAIVNKKSISINHILYASFSKKNGFRVAPDQLKPYSKANLYLSKLWTLQNIPKMNTNMITKSYEYPLAPPILHLRDDEKFKDDKGHIVEIETRGTRTEKSVYFLVSDVENAFNIIDLNDTLRKSAGYVKNEDYKTFLRQDKDLIPLHTNKRRTFSCQDKDLILLRTSKRRIFLTYEGMIKTLYSSRSKKAKTFRSWATNTLFTIQMGTKEQKEILVSGVLGIPAKSLREVLKKSAKVVSCIYLFTLGKARDLRSSMKLDDKIHDDYLIVKYGMTTDLVRRTREHMKTYETEIKGSKLELLQYVYIDPKFLHKAETDIKEFFHDIETKIAYKKFDEIIAVQPNHVKQINRQYKLLNTEYSGCVKELTDTISELRREHKMTLERHEMSLERLQWKLTNKDRIIEQKDLIIISKDKDNEILRLRLELSKIHT